MAKKRRSRVLPVVKTDGDTTTIDTGIYRRTIRHVEPQTKAVISVGKGKRKVTFQALLIKSEAELRADSEAWNAEPERTLQLIRQQAVRFYGEHAVEVSDMANPPLRTAMQRHDLGYGLRTYQLPDDAPPVARDAGDVLQKLHMVEICENGYKLLAALNAGRLYERMLVRQLEYRALIGLKHERRNQRTGMKRYAAAEIRRQERRRAVQGELSNSGRKSGRVDLETAYRVVAQRRNESVSTIKKAWLSVP